MGFVCISSLTDHSDKMTRSTIPFAVLVALVGAANAQTHIGCFVKGECQHSSFLAVTGTAEFSDCLQFCKVKFNNLVTRRAVWPFWYFISGHRGMQPFHALRFWQILLCSWKLRFFWRDFLHWLCERRRRLQWPGLWLPEHLWIWYPGGASPKPRSVRRAMPWDRGLWMVFLLQNK